MQLNQVTYFLRLCDTLNFTRAAELCHVSQPSLSAGIKKLEDELGGALFVRQGRSIELTELGEAMRIHLSAIEQAKNAASLIASGITQSEAHRINLGFMCTLSPDRLMEAIATFSQDNSSSELLVHDVWASNALDLLTAESLDCIIMAHTSSLPEQFVQHTLSKEPMMLAMSASNPLSEQDQIGFEDLNNHAYVDRLRCEFREVFFKELGQRKLNVQVVMRSEREDLVRDSVRYAN